MMQDRANFPKLVGGDQALHPREEGLLAESIKEFNTHANIRVKRKVYEKRDNIPQTECDLLLEAE